MRITPPEIESGMLNEPAARQATGRLNGPTSTVTQVTCGRQRLSLTMSILMDLRALVLSELGMTVDHTPLITRGLELLDSQRFDAIVLDYRADQSSEQFLARLRQSAKNRASMLIAIVDSEFNARPVFGLGA